MVVATASDPIRVAIVGSGLAGLTTAYLLHNDARKRYEVTVFEQAQALSFDSQSVAVKNRTTGKVERVDLPMRASAGGYYASLMRLYEHLKVPMHPVQFLFVFAQAFGGPSPVQPRSRKLEDHPGSYFVHTSNLHSIPPPRPASSGLVAHVWETLFLVVCYAWFSVACFLIEPRSSGAPSKDGLFPEEETIAEYLRRIWIPERYASHYLVPLMSSVSTCSHAELLAFPARDVVNYKKLSHGQLHYTVCGGVNTVQSKLSEGLKDIRLGTSVTKVLPAQNEKGATVSWRTTLGDNASGPVLEERFDRVVLAVSPDVAARIFGPLTASLEQIPTIKVSSSVISPTSPLREKGSEHVVETGEPSSASACMHHANGQSPAQRIMLRTRFHGRETKTEALHVMPSGVTVSTCPLDENADGETLKTARFTRTLRNAKSQAIVRSLTRARDAGEEDDGSGWANGDDGVWLTGAWCWDGMVLLEGCVVSAMRVARDFGVDIPWESEEGRERQ
ncbi:hypothetical protein NLU13_5871 [Sarocladium strictum]|uniref:Amine oxidase domain-containing protein n=1 Tax=Sarocladium strictum TaxID=5046 RepID=A0AA39GGE7_SARSR|nr:hypothetical protein NLU13_5871 [Sarocladium strictum]